MGEGGKREAFLLFFLIFVLTFFHLLLRSLAERDHDESQQVFQLSWCRLCCSDVNER